MRILIVLIVSALLSACRSGVRPDLPEASTAVLPKVQIVERIVYVKIPERLTKQEAVPEGPIAQCFDVAAARRAVIERQNARAAEIATIEGTEVKP
ncbi:hypothetical protein [Pseudoxanthomonas indica]|uniref:Lipoprotein n=1 Tax=Pseudoxanthomonas indica TaxID=428993 RepID=A0A1T5K0N6_9GAMM|nr:hypothetical protein [Pseudoxanthomonas indica]GGD45740.1 hypothetical protein GCM10007235_17100 [Pseudoxanthomonas indica]SKC57183.1 hypothetical protein SAMN06296058_1251 [Pseudoxanthomonas indica]